jgi:hypothetical protein
MAFASLLFLPWMKKIPAADGGPGARTWLAHKNADRRAGPGIGAQLWSFNLTNKVICPPASTLKIQASPANRRMAEGWSPRYQRKQKRMAPELAAL